VRGVAWIPGAGSFAAAREARLDLLGDLIANHVDGSALRGLIDGSNLTAGRAGLPVVTTGLAV
jgi:adenosylcobyric acid synthase